MLESQPQHTTGMTTSPPAVVGLNTALLAARHQPAHRHRYQHATPREAAPAICTAVALSVSGVCAIRSTGAPGAARCAPAGAAPCADGQL
jgi:hypothetical protein